MVVAAPIIAEMNTPRFIALGDTATLGLDVHNLSGSTQALKLEVTSGAGLTLADGNQSVNLKDKEKTTLRFKVNATGSPGLVDLLVKVKGDKIKFERHFALEIEAPTPLQPLLDAQKGGVESFLSSAGGVPNIGALAKSLFGDTISKALGAVLSQDAANTAEAGQLYGNAATGYGSAATSAGKNASGLASGIGSGITGVLSGINGLKPKSPGVATGPGTSGQSDITVPSPGDTSGLDIPSGPAGFGGQDVPDLVTA